jgi:hypothetical protein
MFFEGLEVTYKKMNGIIDFICDQYVVIQVSFEGSASPARLLVFTENYDQIELIKASTK